MKMFPIDEDIVKRVAKIFGPMSAAAQALGKAAEHRSSGYTAHFYQAYDKSSSAIIVERGIKNESTTPPAPDEARGQ